MTPKLKQNLHDYLEEVRAEHEDFLTKLEALAVIAIATNDWTDFYAHVVEFQCEHDLHGITGIAIGERETQTEQASAEVLTRPSADLNPTTRKEPNR